MILSDVFLPERFFQKESILRTYDMETLSYDSHEKQH